jgi:hypothetical protein
VCVCDRDGGASKKKETDEKTANEQERIRDAHHLSEKKFWLLGYMIPIGRKGARARTRARTLQLTCNHVKRISTEPVFGERTNRVFSLA